MRCPNKNELPSPPAGKVGWPWTEDSPQLQDRMLDDSPWPRISIVTPSFNQGKFIEETIRSVLLQGYPDLEYIIIDGGSSDSSSEIIVKYEKWLTYWISEPDRGQSHALKKGFSKSTGDILGWLNSDDIYRHNIFKQIGIAYRSNQGSIIAGKVLNFDNDNKQETIIEQHNITLENMVKFWEHEYSWHQPGIFFPRYAYEKAGGLDESLRFYMDHDLICRLLQYCRVTYIEDIVACFRLHETSKTCSIFDYMLEELSLVSKRYWQLIASIDTVLANKRIGGMYARSFLDRLHRREFIPALRILKSALKNSPQEFIFAFVNRLRQH